MISTPRNDFDDRNKSSLAGLKKGAQNVENNTPREVSKLHLRVLSFYDRPKLTFATKGCIYKYEGIFLRTKILKSKRILPFTHTHGRTVHENQRPLCFYALFAFRGTKTDRLDRIICSVGN